jgi:arylsulfatase A-like enzyme
LPQPFLDLPQPFLELREILATEAPPPSRASCVRPNLLLVLVDDLRFDRLGCTGLARAETPFLDGLARRGVLFTRCFSTCGWTLPSCASIVTGRLPSGHGLVHHDRRFAAPKIPALLPGYATFGVGNNGNLVPDDIPQETLDALQFERRPEMWKRFGWQEGFETYRWHHKEDKDGPFADFSQWLAARPTDARPWFAMLHTNLVHDYDMGHPWAVECERFLGRPLSPAMRKFRDGPWVWKDLPEAMTDAQVTEEALAKYDACVAEADLRLAGALEPIDWESTVVVVVSDHGEGFDGPRDRVHHCGRLHDDLLHVPLIVVGMGRKGIVETPCSTIDIASTLVRLAGGNEAGLPGADLRDLPPQRRIEAEDFGYLYLPPNDVAERLRRFESRSHDIAVRCAIEWPRKRIEARIDRQEWSEEYDLELDPDERINRAVGPQAPTRRPEKDEGAVAAKWKDWRTDSAEKERLAVGTRWSAFVRANAHRRRLPAGDGANGLTLRPATFVVAVDDPAELRLHVLASPVFQSGTHQWLFVENAGNRAFTSISRLYHEAVRRARHELRLFVHQDVFFPPQWDSEFARRLVGVPTDWGVLGVAGRAPRAAGDAEPPNIGHWSDPHKYHKPTVPLPAEVQILDEMLLVVRADSDVTFDPELPGFHCYGADLCLAARDRAMKSYVVDAPLVHKLFRPDGSLIESSEDSPKIAARRTEAFRADFQRSADYVARKWSKYLPFESPSHRWDALPG